MNYFPVAVCLIQNAISSCLSGLAPNSVITNWFRQNVCNRIVAQSVGMSEISGSRDRGSRVALLTGIGLTLLRQLVIILLLEPAEGL